MQIKDVLIYLGCDPEFFFTKKGKIVGSEKIIPEDGLLYEPGSTSRRDGGHTALEDISSKIIIDGVQAELNPRPNTCRANLANEISACFLELVGKIDKEVDVDFSGVVNVGKKEFDSLTEKSKQFGCAPDINVYKGYTNTIKINPKKYRKRSAGGHIHLGVNYYDVSGNGTNYQQYLKPKKLNLHELKDGKKLIRDKINSFLHCEPIIKLTSVALALQSTDRLIPILDIILGNTCVLLDRNPLAAERRKIYGRAGDYRLTNYGIEYRTLSNFWLQSYQLMSFVTGLARTAVMIVASTIGNDIKCEEELFKATNLSNIQKAINKNDFDLAMENFQKIEPILLKHTYSGEHFPLTNSTIREFKHMVKTGIDYWFPKNPLEYWISLPDTHGTGWESFASNKIRREL